MLYISIFLLVYLYIPLMMMMANIGQNMEGTLSN
jgi:hypothetical protein